MTEVQKVLESALNDVREDLDRIEVEWKALGEKRDRAMRERDGLLLALERHTGAPVATNAASTNEATEWTRMNRSEAVLKVLGEHGEPLSPINITAALRRNGRVKDTSALVSSTLSKLQEQGRAVREGYGAWAVATPQNTSGPDESGPEVQVTTTGAGGDSNAAPDENHGDLLAGWDRDHRVGAPVGAST